MRNTTRKTVKRHGLSESSSSNETVPSPTLTGTLALGAKIAGDLGKDADSNVTGKWIAHHLAEKLEAAETDPAAKAECEELVLKLWRARQTFPTGDPFERYDRILSTIEKLASDGFGFDHLLAQDTCASDDKSSSWLCLAKEIDRRAKYLVAVAIEQATIESSLGDDPLVELAADVDPDQQTEALQKLRLVFIDGKGLIVEDKRRDLVREAIDALTKAAESFRESYGLTE